MLWDQGYLLLKSRDDLQQQHAPPRDTVVSERRVRLGEWTELDGPAAAANLLGLDVSLTWWGRLRQLLFRLPGLRLELRVEGYASNRSFRITPDLVRSPFLLNPHVDRTVRLVDVYAGSSRPRVTALRVVAESRCYAQDVGIRLLRRDQLVLDGMASLDPELLSDTELERLAVVSLPAGRMVDSDGVKAEHYQKEWVLKTSSDSTLRLLVPPGRHSISVSFGVETRAYEQEQKRTDGVSFRILRERDDGSSVEVFRRLLDPGAVAGDRGDQTFTSIVELAPGELLVFRTGPGPAGDAVGDWAYWSTIHID